MVYRWMGCEMEGKGKVKGDGPDGGGTGMERWNMGLGRRIAE